MAQVVDGVERLYSRRGVKIPCQVSEAIGDPAGRELGEGGPQDSPARVISFRRPSGMFPAWSLPFVTAVHREPVIEREGRAPKRSPSPDMSAIAAFITGEAAAMRALISAGLGTSS